MTTVDILMITYNRPIYTRAALRRLLETCDESMRVWLWHNGEHKETLDIVRSHANHPRVHEFYHSRENRLLREPTNWFWQNASAELLGKVDDDCLTPIGWVEPLRKAHEDISKLGVVGCWIFLEEDYVPELCRSKLHQMDGCHMILRNHWLGGSGYLMKRQCIEEQGPLRAGQSFPNYCLNLARRGWINGYYFPLLYMDHMDDPRSPNTLMRTEADFQINPSLSSRRFGTPSLQAMRARAREAALEVQRASLDLKEFFGWQAKARRVRDRLLGRVRKPRFNA